MSLYRKATPEELAARLDLNYYDVMRGVPEPPIIDDVMPESAEGIAPVVDAEQTDPSVETRPASDVSPAKQVKQVKNDARNAYMREYMRKKRAK